MIKYIDKENNFIEVFNQNTGFYVRSGVIENGRDTGIDPFKRNYPSLIDVGIMGRCRHGSSGLCIKSGIQCYQNGLKVQKPNMPLEDFKKIVDQCKSKTFQFALGGRGDVDQHEHCEEILNYCKENDIVPNFTTSGLGLTPEICEMLKQYVGAVAVSWYRAEHTHRAIEMLISAGIKTNIHYVLGQNTIDEAIKKLSPDSSNSFPSNINAIIFLMHKPVGMGSHDNILDVADPRVGQFFKVIDTQQFDFKIGFDSCSCSGIVNFTKNINLDSIDYCEGGRYSMYIDAQMNAMPCSFANDDESWFVNLNEYTILEAWNSSVFEKFRYSLKHSCNECKDRLLCGGGCPLPKVNCITLCDRKERDFVWQK